MQEVWLGDCLELMQNISDKSIDLILCDLPYGTTQNKWDVILPFENLWKHYKRIAKGAIVLNAAQPFTSLLITSNLKDFKYNWIWQKEKGTGHLNAKKQPMRNVEDVVVFYSTQPTYNPQMTPGTPYKDKAGKNHDEKTSMSANYGTFTNFRNDNAGTRYPKQILNFNVVGRNGIHPTQKPVELCEYLIKTYTNEQDVVLDNCAGSGSTLVAAKNLNRQFIGIEKNFNYYQQCLTRLNLSE